MEPVIIRLTRWGYGETTTQQWPVGVLGNQIRALVPSVNPSPSVARVEWSVWPEARTEALCIPLTNIVTSARPEKGATGVEVYPVSETGPAGSGERDALLIVQSAELDHGIIRQRILRAAEAGARQYHPRTALDAFGPQGRNTTR
jgi:hypothetical protein